MILVYVVFLGFLVYIGYKYVTVGLSKYLSNKDAFLSARRSYVKNNKKVYGVCNNGTSLDQRNIYVLTLEELGLGGSDNGTRYF